jgi:long-chain acyl-CoA synthetase
MRTLPYFFEESVEKFSDHPYLWEKRDGRFIAATYKEIQREVHRFAAGLMSLGIKKGDHLALLSEGRNDWLIAELGVLYAGALNIPLSILLNDSEIKFRLEHGEARMLIVSKTQTAKLESFLGALSNLEKIIHLDPKKDLHPNEILFHDIKKMGDEFLAKHPDQFKQNWQSIRENDLANISYTSGTTAEPKGIMLSHLNYYANVQQAYSMMDLDPTWTIFLFLPWDHSFAHTSGLYAFMGKGASLASLQVGKTPMETLKNIPVNIKEIQPQIMFSVPAFAKNLRKNIERGIHDKGSMIRTLFHHALKVSYSYNKDGFRKGGGRLFLNRILMGLYDAIIFKKVRQQLGGKMEYFIGGGALLDIELQRFFYAIGIPIYQGYGLSEAAPMISINTPEVHKMGSSGRPVKFMEIKICNEDGEELPTGQKGEIMVRGENVMQGYWKNEQATKETIEDGWLHTGDMGYLDEDGFLFVLGRFKSLLIADDGEKYSPEGIEEAITDQSEYIMQCMLYNNQNPYTIILVVPDREAIRRFLKKEDRSLKNEVGKKAVLKLIQSEIHAYRTGGKYAEQFPQRWMPSTIGILDQEFTMENHFLNSMRKMVRNKIIEQYQGTIDFLYSPEAKDINNSRNFEALEKLGMDR